MTSTLGALLAKKHGISQIKRTVVRSEEFKRIADIARREFYEDLSEMMTELYKTPQGTMKLWTIQAIINTEIYNNNGGLACVRVGGGKTLSTLLLPVMMEAERPLLIVPAALKKKTVQEDIPFYSQHWEMHDNLKIMSYSELSTESKHDILFSIVPDLIIADECHYLRNPGAGRTRRFLRYFNHFPQTKFAGFSGTITKRSIKDYWHLIKIALKENSPLPRIFTELQDWADAIDDGVDETSKIDPGALLDFCRDGETVRQGYRRRFVETPGVITTEEGALGTSLILKEHQVSKIPDEIIDAFRKLRTTWCTPGGEEITDALSLNRHSKELSAGFYYRWVWPNDEPDHEWIDARKSWKKFVRQTIKGMRKNPLDTELQVFNACRNKQLVSFEYDKWVQIRDRVNPVTEAVWISDYVVKEIEKWISKNKQGIVWIEHQALGEKLKAKGLKYYGGGDDSILQEKETFAASIASHGTGKNLQHFNKNLFVTIPTSGQTWEQTLGRTHRPGQMADEVTADLLLHTRELWSSFFQARKDANYIETTVGQKQKLQYASIDITSEGEAMNRMLYSSDPLWSVGDIDEEN